MKRGMFIFLLVVVFLIGLVIVISIDDLKKSIVGEVITGELTTANLAVTISITGPPVLTILKPLNQTYFENESLRLKVSTNTNDMWYNLDNGANVTFVDDVLFNTSEGSHIIYVFANNSFGTTTKNVTFNVDDSIYEILYDEFKDSDKGSSTNFNEFSYDEIQNLSDIVLEDTQYGKISFNEIINVTNDANTSDSKTDLDSNVNISFNFIELNSIALPNFDKVATLKLYNLTFTNPRILKDGVVCSSSICTKISYSGGILVFNVTGFTVYSAEETPSEVSQEPEDDIVDDGGGAPAQRFTVDTEKILVSLFQGEVKTKTIVVKNTGRTRLELELEILKLGNLISLSEDRFFLDAGESKTITIDFISREDLTPDLYLGSIIIKSAGKEKNILISIEIESRDALFDVEAEILKEFKLIEPGNEIVSEIKLFNLGSSDGVEVLVEYEIRNEEGNKIIKESEMVVVETQSSFAKRFFIPKEASIGYYILYVKVTTPDGKVVSSTSLFEVVHFVVPLKEKLYILIFIFIVILLGLVVYYLVRSRDKTVKRGSRKIELKRFVKRS